MAEPVLEQETPADILLDLAGELRQDGTWQPRINIAEVLDDNELSGLGEKCKLGFEEDKESMGDWLDGVDRGMKLAKQIYEAKNHPWPNASNIKLPLISMATLQFAAGAYTELVKSGDVVKANHPGLTPIAEAVQAENEEAAAEFGPSGVELKARADRVVKYMNWQLIYQMEEWEADMDQLLHVLPVVGCVHKKCVYDPLLGRPDITTCDPRRIVVNQSAKSIDRAPRISEEIELTENELHERVTMGLFLEQDYQPCEESQDGKTYEFVEQHRWSDLDEDGYAEPYIVTYDKSSGKVARVVARFEEDDILVNQKGEIGKINAVQHYRKYSFIPDFDGGYWDLGWAHLMGPITASANTLVNQLTDAGTLQNTQGGFMSQSVKLQEGGTISLKMGEWKRVKSTAGKLADAFYKVPTQEPSMVLFQLLGFITELGQELSSVMDVNMGDAPPGLSTMSVLTMVEQGQKVFNSIYKRIYRAQRGELKLLYRFNRVYTDPREYQVLLNQPGDPQQDFNDEDLDVLPTASPELSSKHQRRAQAEAMRYAAYDPAGMAVPGVNVTEVAKFFYEQVTDEVDRFVPPPSEEDDAAQQDAKDFEEFMRVTKAQLEAVELKLKEAKLQESRSGIVVDRATAENKDADTLKKLAETDEIERGETDGS